MEKKVLKDQIIKRYFHNRKNVIFYENRIEIDKIEENITKKKQLKWGKKLKFIKEIRF